MSEKMQKYLLTANGIILLINLFLVGWQLKLQNDLNKGFVALDKSFTSLKNQHGVMSATYQKNSDEGLSLTNEVRFCSMPENTMAVNLNPENHTAKFWSEYDHDNPQINEPHEYEYTISDGVVTLKNAEHEVPYRVFRVIEVFHDETQNIIKGISGGIDMYTDWCGG